MPRIPRSSFNTNFFHIMVQGINKEYIFSKNDYIETYLNLIHKYIQDFSVTILAYCIMNNHAHILLYVDDIKDLGKFMHRVNLVYSQFYNKKNNRCGVVFRNKFKSEPIYERKYIINCINYIHLNPVKAKMVHSCEEYPYSSYNNFVNNTGICNNKVLYDLTGINYNFTRTSSSTENSIFIDIDPPTFSDIKVLMDQRIALFLRYK